MALSLANKDLTGTQELYFVARVPERGDVNNGSQPIEQIRGHE